MEDFSRIPELFAVLDAAYEAAVFKGCDMKFSESSVSVHLGKCSVVREQFGESPADDKPVIEIFAYVFGGSRRHYFDSVDEAIEAVKGWRAEVDEWEPLW